MSGNLGARSQDNSESSTLKSDQEPFVGDFSLVDSVYIVGPGDLFQIFSESFSIEKQVNAEGNLILNRIGVLHVDGLTLKEARKLILDNLQTSHKRANCFVNLSKPKVMRIFVTGAVKNPGVYQVNGNNRLSDGIELAKGFSLLAQKSEIQLISKDGSSQNISLKKFLSSGDLQSNPYLTQGCIIHVPFIDYAKSWVTIRTDSGSFVVQVEPDETILDLIIKSHSFAPPEPFSAVVVTEKNGKDQLLSPSEASKYKPLSEARIEVLTSRQEVFVGGAVSKPGFQTYNSNHKIIQYISEAGLTTSSKIPDEIDVIRKNGKREKVALQEPLQPGDVVYVDMNTEQRFLIYTPILLSIVSLTLALLSLKGL